ncbi:MAG: asparagine synthase (glutamine-hydrolyzing) [Fibrobacteria bacterium]
MCGISGIFNPRGPLGPDAKSACERMNGAMLHRGPDQGGFHEDDGLVLGHRRLSIIDLSSGQQPMISGCGNYAVVFNGEIYNFAELRRELEGLGHVFRTRSDTEILLEGYKAWGRELLGRLRGMFAFAVHDRRAKVLFGARDPIGKKPLYYRLAGDTLYFASDLNALRASGVDCGPISAEAMSLYFSLGYVPAPYCILSGARKLASGEAFSHSPKGFETWTYWDIALGNEDASMDEAAAVERLEGLLDMAVSRRLVSEVPLGAFLSGGIDSNLVVSTMARASKEPVKTYCAGFGERTALHGVRDERELAAAAAAHYHSVHEEIRIAPDGDVQPASLMPYLGEPLADPSIIPTYLVCREARKRVTVVLTGDGGDEPFGGYSFRYLPHLREQKIRSMVPGPLLGPLAASMGGLAGMLPGLGRLRVPMRNLAVGPGEAFYLDQCLWAGEAGLLGGSLAKHRDAARDLVLSLYARAAGRDDLTRMLYVDTRLYMCEDVLVKADRMSMANSIELRSPLLDQDLVSFAFTLPGSLKIKGGECKRPLREVARRRIAPGLADQPKTGFSFPLESYLRAGWKAEFESAVFAPDSVLREHLDLGKLRDVWRRFQAGENGKVGFLWAAFVFALWAENPAAPVRS